MTAPSAPLPSTLPPSPPPVWLPPPPPPSTYGGPAGAPPRRRRSRLLIVVVIVVVVLIVASIVAAAFLTAPAPAIQVQYIVAWAPDNVCGLQPNPLAFYGYNGSTGASLSVDLIDWGNYNSTSCTVNHVITNTTGFTLSGIQVPLTIPGGDQNASMNLTVTSPGSSFSGDLNLVFS